MPTNSRIALVLFAVDDVARAARFYAAAFAGRRPSMYRVSSPSSRRRATATGEATGLGLYVRGGFARSAGAPPIPAPQAGHVAASELYVVVHDLDAAIASLLAAGATPLSPRALRDWGDDVAYFRDPDGNVVAVAGALEH